MLVERITEIDNNVFNTIYDANSASIIETLGMMIKKRFVTHLVMKQIIFIFLVLLKMVKSLVMYKHYQKETT